MTLAHARRSMSNMREGDMKARVADLERKLAAIEGWARKVLEPEDEEVQHFVSAWEFNDVGEEYDGERLANELRRILGWPERDYR